MFEYQLMLINTVKVSVEALLTQVLIEELSCLFRNAQNRESRVVLRHSLKRQGKCYMLPYSVPLGLMDRETIQTGRSTVCMDL